MAAQRSGSVWASVSERCGIGLRTVCGLGELEILASRASCPPLGAGYTLLRNDHVRIDVIASRLSKRAQTWIDIVGTVFFLFPMAILIMWLSWPLFVEAYARHEISTNAGGLVIWPARLLVPVGFFLLIVQGISELIKRIAFLRGLAPDPTEKPHEKSLEEQLAEEIARERGEEEILAEAAKARGDKQ